MRILAGQPMEKIASLKADDFAKMASVTDVRLARAYNEAIDYLQKELQRRPSLPNIKLALARLYDFFA